MAAGTGGHVFPALAVAKQLQSQGHTIHWLGTPTGMENRLLTNESSITMHHVAMKGMRGNGIIRKLATPFKLFTATLSAINILKTNKIDAVAGFGGYVAAPGGLATKLTGLPLAIHEQNAIAGMTNRYLAKIANKVLEAFPNTFAASNKVLTVGNPVRSEIIKLGEHNLQNIDANTVNDAKQINILVIGGSLGAQILNETVPPALKLVDKPVHIIHQTGRGHLESTQQNYKNADLTTDKHQYEITEFVTDMASAYKKADILICRAGASTVSEVAVAGVPAIFVPLPHAVDDHQTANAKFLSADESAVLLPQSELSPSSLADTINQINNEQTLQDMHKKTIAKGLPNSTEVVATEIMKLIDK